MLAINSINVLLSALALGLILWVCGTVPAFGQDDDEQRRSDRRSRPQQDDSDRKSRKQQDHSDKKSGRQQERSDRNSSDQHNSDRESRRQQRRSDGEAREQQVNSDWNSRRQQERSDSGARRQQHSSDRQSRRQQVWGDWRRRGDDDDRNRRNRTRRDGDRRVNVYRAPAQTIFGNIFKSGQIYSPRYERYGRGSRRVDQRFYNEERRSRRRFENGGLRYNRGYEPTFGNGDYDNKYYSDDERYNEGSDWKQQILRVVIANIIGNRLGGDQYVSTGQYAPEYRNQPFYGGDRRSAYMSNAPFGQNYNDLYADQTVFGDGGGLFSENAFSGGLLGSLPIAELIEQYTGGGGFASELLGNVLTQGYDQGYLAGETARQNGYGDSNYQNPYPYEGDIPYSVSVGENRRCLSEGYEIGYQDALSGQTGYDPESDGNVDLLSLLVSNVLGNV